MRSNGRGPVGEVFLGSPRSLVASEYQYHVISYALATGGGYESGKTVNSLPGRIEREECQNRGIMFV